MGTKESTIFQKYSWRPSKHCGAVVEGFPAETMGLLSASVTSDTWAKKASVLNCYKKFDEQSPKSHVCPLSVPSVCEFITWAMGIDSKET